MRRREVLRASNPLTARTRVLRRRLVHSGPRSSRRAETQPATRAASASEFTVP
jgi:hypothetical protein